LEIAGKLQEGQEPQDINFSWFIFIVLLENIVKFDIEGTSAITY
jgi:hypothetical protein